MYSQKVALTLKCGILPIPPFLRMSDESPTPAPGFHLTPEEVRVLGCLVEKEITLPDYYPMTLNALVTACNQTTNRDPVVRYDERTVLRAMERMKSSGLAFEVNIVGGRALKYRHNLKTHLPGLARPHMALLCMLLLRGVQTVGELRQRTDRLHEFPDLQSVENALAELIGHHNGPVVQCLPAGPGRRVAQYAHLLGAEAPGDPAAESQAWSSSPATPSESGGSADSTAASEADWRARMEAEIALLKAQVSRLQALVGVAK